MLSETKGKKLGSLSCRGLKPPVVRGHAAAFTYWFNAFGHSGPYSQSIQVLPDGSQKVIGKGNPMNSPGKWSHSYLNHDTSTCSLDLPVNYTDVQGISSQNVYISWAFL